MLAGECLLTMIVPGSNLAPTRHIPSSSRALYLAHRGSCGYSTMTHRTIVSTPGNVFGCFNFWKKEKLSNISTKIPKKRNKIKGGSENTNKKHNQFSLKIFPALKNKIIVVDLTKTTHLSASGELRSPHSADDFILCTVGIFPHRRLDMHIITNRGQHSTSKMPTINGTLCFVDFFLPPNNLYCIHFKNDLHATMWYSIAFSTMHLMFPEDHAPPEASVERSLVENNSILDIVAGVRHHSNRGVLPPGDLSKSPRIYFNIGFKTKLSALVSKRLGGLLTHSPTGR